MIIDISDIRKNKGRSKRFQGSLSDLSLDLSGQTSAFRGLQIDCEATNTGEGIFVHGKITGKLDLTCSLCLNSFTVDVKVPFAENYYREGESIPEDVDDPVQLYHGNKIDLSATIKENLVLSMPMKPLCRPDCRGLCVHCGSDLNIKQCSCKDDNVDPRLSVLGELLKDLDLEKNKTKWGKQKNGSSKKKNIKISEKQKKIGN